MITYKGYTIEKLACRGIYQIISADQDIICVLPLLRDCKKVIDAKAGI